MQIPFQLKNETIYLIADDANYALARFAERTRNCETKPELVSFKWFATLSGALNRIIDLKVKNSDARTLMELIQAVEAARAEIIQICQTSSLPG